ncbi:hypothetical protein GUITHDRAFT_147039 [Guillardia theta CCMP2712]|uniref:Uncharacterized protein n=2 Tax=Guillardia theta TaxID=55529 RepID=L1IFN8_GUITC|nr:hypothetical protein GUITHDRAFT_147039 [Guillardia theta CCMP2712]EKX34724.1 hypothetical protein GUITHDRAFT_147039 [Guillardia theta CCMP2712]|eukprot:XP_005821704.1 hypothetical protein GUITHDRAFT_147039 [Guillardia theta CCMP2712]
MATQTAASWFCYRAPLHLCTIFRTPEEAIPLMPSWPTMCCISGPRRYSFVFPGSAPFSFLLAVDLFALLTCTSGDGAAGTALAHAACSLSLKCSSFPAWGLSPSRYKLGTQPIEIQAEDVLPLGVKLDRDGRKNVNGAASMLMSRRSRTRVEIEGLEPITDSSYHKWATVREITNFPFPFHVQFDSEVPTVGGGTVEEFVLLGELVVARNKISEQRVAALLVTVSPLLVRVLDLFTARPIPRVCLRLTSLSGDDLFL